MGNSLRKIGLLSFSDGRTRVHEGLGPGILAREGELAAFLGERGVEVVRGQVVAHTPREAVREAKRALAADVGGDWMKPLAAFAGL